MATLRPDGTLGQDLSALVRLDTDSSERSAVVVGVGKKTCSVVLDKGSRPLDHKRFVGGIPKIGDKVLVKFKGMEATVHVPAEAGPSARGAGLTIIGNATGGSGGGVSIPIAHAASHAIGGSDPLTPAAIGAATTGDISTAIVAHETDPDPHPQYLTDVEGAGLYLPLVGGTISGDLTVTGLADFNGGATFDNVAADFNAGLDVAAGYPITLGGDVRLERSSANVLALGTGDAFQSQDYVSGSRGFHIDNAYAEFGNATIRGTFASMVLEFDEVSAKAGSEGVWPSAGKLDVAFDVGVSGASTTLAISINEAVKVAERQLVGISQANGAPAYATMDTVKVSESVTVQMAADGALAIAIREDVRVYDTPRVGAPGDFTSPQTMTITTTPAGGWAFATGDIIRMKAVVNGLPKDTWMIVTRTGTTNQYTCLWKSGDRGVVYPAGVGVADYGVSGQGYVFSNANDLVGGVQYAPYMDIRTHAGAPWATENVRLRLGNIRGWDGGGSARYGIGIGDFAGNNYLRYDPTDGFSVKAGAGTVTLDASGIVATSGYIGGWALAAHELTGNDGAGGQISLYPDASGGGPKLWINNASNQFISLVPSGLYFAEGSTDTPPHIYFVNQSPGPHNVARIGVSSGFGVEGESMRVQLFGEPARYAEVITSVKSPAIGGGSNNVEIQQYEWWDPTVDSGNSATWSIVGVKWASGTPSPVSVLQAKFNQSTLARTFLVSGATTINTVNGAPAGGQRVLGLGPAAYTGIATTTEQMDVYFGLARTMQWAAGTVTTQRNVVIDRATFTGASATAHFDNAYTFYVVGQPVISTNASADRLYGSYLGGPVVIGSLPPSTTAPTTGVQQALNIFSDRGTTTVGSLSLTDINTDPATTGGGIFGAHQYVTSTMPVADDRLGGFLAGILLDSSGVYTRTAGLTIHAEGTFTSGSSYPSYIRFDTTPASSNSRAERLRITAAGKFIIPIGNLSSHVDNAAAIAAGLSQGMLYRRGQDPDLVCIVH